MTTRADAIDELLDEGHGRGRPGLVIRRHPKTGARHLDELIWGLRPEGAGDDAPRPIHARAETVASNAMFADAFRHRRAIVPAQVYYQRRTTAGPSERFAISRKDRQPMAWGGLWEAYRQPDGEIVRTYCIITVPANGALSPIHDRMPLMIEKADWPVWLGEIAGDYAALLRSAPEDALVVRRVGGRREKRPCRA
jgi:putative SOS response-associated peptidase YedK